LFHYNYLNYINIYDKDGTLLYVAPDTGRDGMAELISSLNVVGIICVEQIAAPERY
jgi:hypothetical protein